MMSITELHEEMCIPTRDLKQAVHVRGQMFARKTSGGGKWMIDTAEYEKWRLKQIK
jgi:hypothetical protein